MAQVYFYEFVTMVAMWQSVHLWRKSRRFESSWLRFEVKNTMDTNPVDRTGLSISLHFIQVHKATIKSFHLSSFSSNAQEANNMMKFVSTVYISTKRPGQLHSTSSTTSTTSSNFAIIYLKSIYKKVFLFSLLRPLSATNHHSISYHTYDIQHKKHTKHYPLAAAPSNP